MAVNGGSKVDFTITGHLPPSNRRKRSVVDVKSKTTKMDHRKSSSNAMRPSSVPVSPIWDENTPVLAVQSTPIPLSSRSSHGTGNSHTSSPCQNSLSYRSWSRDSGIRTLSSSSTSVLYGTSRPRVSRTLSRSTRKEHGPFSVTSRPPPRTCTQHSQSLKMPPKVTQRVKSDTDLLDTSDESIPEILDQSISKLSSEVDSIIHDINSGLIVGSPAEGYNDCTVKPVDIERSGSTVIKDLQSVSHSFKLKTGSSVACAETVLPHLNLTNLEEDFVHSRSTEEVAAHKIQKWFRECQKGKKRERKEDYCQREAAAMKIQRWFRSKRGVESDLTSLLSSQRKRMSRNRQEEEQRIMKTYETEKAQEEERQQRRAMKMQAARKQAIESLKKKREEERKEKEKIIQEEMAMIEASGAVKKGNCSGKSTKRKLKVAANFNLESEKAPPTPASQSHSHSKKHQNKPKEPSVQAKINQSEDTVDKRMSEVSSSIESSVVDEFFKAGPRKTTPKRQSEPKSPSRTPEQKHPNTTTVSDIFATLKELEEAPPPLPGTTPMPPTSNSYLSKSNLEMFQRHSVTTNISDQKLQSILSYLDDIQKTEQMVARPQVMTEKSDGNDHKEVPPEVQEDLSQQLEAASAVANDVTTTIVTQRMEIENKNKTIEMLQKALNQQRELTVYHAKEMEKESQKRLELQKQEYEGTIGRHQCFIDQLIDDKKTLSDKCEELLKEVKEIDRKSKTKIKTMEDTHAAELEKQKQTSVATEKLRRERWRADETQRIKEATVKSLEPEIQRIIARGKAEIQKLKAMHEAELLQADERASRRFLQQTEELRVQCAQEKEMACQHERELARQKYEQLAEQEEQSYQQLRRKLYSEVQQEKDKLASETSIVREEIGRQLKELKESHQLEMTRVKMEHESVTAETQRRHMSELRDLKERMSIEKQAWEENYIRKQDAVLLTREREMRERLRRERDMEIESVIQKLEAETATTREEIERTAESRVKRIREKYETELKEVEKSERNTLEKFNTMKSQLTEYEGDIIRLRSQLKQREEEVERVNEIATRLTRERDRVSEVVRQEFADRLVALEEENRHIKLEISELKSRHSLELSRKERDKERELEEVHQRVKEALAKKEENYRTLRSQHEAALKRADHLEMLLEQQRKQLLKR